MPRPLACHLRAFLEARQRSPSSTKGTKPCQRARDLHREPPARSGGIALCLMSTAVPPPRMRHHELSREQPRPPGVREVGPDVLRSRSSRLLRQSVAPSYVSLFSGCGGLDLGFLRAGYRALHAYDIDTAAVRTYNYNLGSSGASVADLRAGLSEAAPHRPDVVIAGPPCQGFSTVGRRDPDDDRNHLLLTPVDYAIRANARVLVLENVCGVLSGLHSRYWNEAVRRLTAGGYTTTTLRVTATTVGLAQIRRRVVLVAARASFNPPRFPTVRRDAPLASVLNIPQGAANHNPQPLEPTSRVGRIAARIGVGQKLSNVRNGTSSVHTWQIPEVFGAVSATEQEFLESLLVLRRRCRRRRSGDADPVPIHQLRDHFGERTHSLLESLSRKDYIRECTRGYYDLRRTFNGKYRRLSPDQPAHAVLTKFCDPTHFLHPFEDRGFTVREAARLQGFPDSFRFLGTDRQQAVQVGNAVPAPVALALARWIRRTLF